MVEDEKGRRGENRKSREEGEGGGGGGGEGDKHVPGSVLPCVT